jgi:hypothetical protein
MFTAIGVIEYAIGTMIMREMAKLSEVEGGAQMQRDLLRTTEPCILSVLSPLA